MGREGVRTMVMKLLMVAIVLLVGLTAVVTSSTSLTEECSAAIQKVTSCLTYATGKAAQPTSECCSTVKALKEQQPVCLCFFIGQAHNGSQQIKSLGIQESKLLQLPSACHLTNVSMAHCPKLLGISPTSPAAAVFMNNNSTSPPSSSSSSTPIHGAGDNSSGFKHENGGLLLLFLSLLILFFGLPLGIESTA